jgi:cytochrome c5
MKKLIPVLSFISLTAALFSCAKENEQALAQNKNASCDLSNISFNADVKPILENECYACHTGSIASGGIVLDNYSGVKAAASGGRLVGAVSHTVGYVPMPLGRTRLSDCNVNTIKAWVNRGMLND